MNLTTPFNNNISNNTMDNVPDYEFSLNYTLLDPAAYIIGCWILAVLGILLNLIFVYLMWKVKEIRTTTNNYLLNMAIADITFLILKIIRVMMPVACDVWVFSHIVLSVSLFSITVISIERFLVLYKPSISNQSRKSFITPLLILTIWVTAVLLSLAQYFLCDRRTDLIEKMLIAFYSLPFFLAIPTTVVLYTFCILALSKVKANKEIGDKTKQIKQVIWMLIFTATAFFLCTLPYLIVQIIQYYTQILNDPQLGITLYQITDLLLMINCVINPIIYQYTKTHRKALFFVLPYCVQNLMIESTIINTNNIV